ncbi:MotA/TolQ/ExbB proton channel family protein [Fuerstiella marisgermanici]|uniref:MotA/TolQ/ExbB proton channel family protein n=1 Tax=Fuerstiella marisgermanici TaxID=1891926 RepID=A0A1P8WHB7_9PLAN|nr:MotA/TolQ/ExbB proton channel family protein [Fuerstiella marisgermanici]APZ93464.1 MotA/TolQ/ExbB proton channel family protein [Fuerstiella marisgermanici]
MFLAQIDPAELGPWLKYLSGLTATVIVGAAAFHLFCFFVLSIWYRRDLSVIAGSLDDFTRGLKHRSVLGRSAPLTNQIDAFVEDINDVVNDPSRVKDRTECLRRMHILDERRSYLDSLSFETAGNVARTMIEAYPLAGVLGTILAIGSALQRSDAATNAASTMAAIVARFGDAIWSTFCGLAAAIILMFINSLLETRFERLTQSRSHVRDMVAKAKRELAMTASVGGPADGEDPEALTETAS